MFKVLCSWVSSILTRSDLELSSVVWVFELMYTLVSKKFNNCVLDF